jgi:hypothetical protein
MPFSPHPHFQPPSNSGATIWRYMDLAKLISMLDRSALYFPRVDTLASGDPFEGYYTNANARFARLTFATASEELKKQWNVSDPKTFDMIMESIRKMGGHAGQMREMTFVSSWHILEHESAAMWAQYLKSQDGIAVQSSYQNLVNSIADCAEFPIHIGQVSYIDYETESIPMGQVMFPMMHKRKSFEHERELRALIWTPEVEGKKNPEGAADPRKSAYFGRSGLYVKTNLDELVTKVFVAPTAPKWFVEVVESLMARYGLKKDVVHSELAASPLW